MLNIPDFIRAKGIEERFDLDIDSTRAFKLVGVIVTIFLIAIIIKLS